MAHLKLSNFWHFRSILIVIAVMNVGNVSAREKLTFEAVDGKGDVQIRVGKNWLPLALGSTIASENAIRTRNNSARLAFSDGSVVALSRNTEVNIESVQSRIFALTRGTFWGKIEKSADPAGSTPTPTRSKPYKFMLHSKSVSMGVRGTEFLVETDDQGVTKISVLEGTIEVAADIDSLSAGEGADLRALERVTAKPGVLAGKKGTFRQEDAVAHLKKNHEGLVRFFGRPVRLSPN